MERDPITLRIGKLPGELHHYTDWTGLAGIWRSQTLWATRFDQLNDRSEIIHFRSAITEALTKAFAQQVRDWQRESFSRKRHIIKLGGAPEFVRKQAVGIVEALYSTSFTGSSNKTPFAVPYITSFCAHGADEQYEKHNGLLSQWRGYGGEERFALVFDAVALTNLVREEDSRFAHGLLAFERVTYNQGIDFSSTYKEIIEYGKNILRTILEESNPDKAKSQFVSVILPFLMAACTLKHQGFREEREVRIIASPMTEEHFQRLSRATGGRLRTGRNLKTLLSRQQNRKSINYVSLFDWQGNKRLPINRIIVGPHVDQDELVRRTSQLVKDEAEVTRSQTPYIG